MNLNAYDIIEEEFKQGTWINPKFKRLYSTEINPRKYCIFLKKYNPSEETTEYYLALTDELPKDRIYHFVIYTKHNVLKINLKDIWDDTPFRNITEKTYLNYTLVEQDDTSEVYYLDV